MKELACLACAPAPLVAPCPAKCFACRRACGVEGVEEVGAVSV